MKGVLDRDCASMKLTILPINGHGYTYGALPIQHGPSSVHLRCPVQQRSCEQLAVTHVTFQLGNSIFSKVPGEMVRHGNI